MPWFRKKKGKIEPVRDSERVVRTENVFVRCEECGEHLYKKELEEALQVCVHCGYHFRLGAYDRLEKLFDDGYCEELDADVVSTDRWNLSTATLRQSHRAGSARHGLPEAVITARGKVGGHRVYGGAMDMNFIGGSMVQPWARNHATDRVRHQRPRAVIIVAASGGARMQEGTLSLMQMAKISAALAALEERHLSFHLRAHRSHHRWSDGEFCHAGDLIIAEPRALVGFAGPRVIEQTIRQKLPKDFQRSEFLLSHGMIDAIVDRREMRPYIIKALNFMMNPDITSESTAQLSGLKFQVNA